MSGNPQQTPEQDATRRADPIRKEKKRPIDKERDKERDIVRDAPDPDEDDVIGEVERPAKPSEKPEALSAAAVDGGGQIAREKEDSKDALANHELDEQTTLARPPLGN